MIYQICVITCKFYFCKKKFNTTADFFCHSRENGNPACLRASKPQLDTRFRGYDGRGGSTFCWYSAVFFQRVAVVLITSDNCQKFAEIKALKEARSDSFTSCNQNWM